MSSPLILCFRRDILSWYGRHKRDLPWRADRDPYKILVSELLLQQTRAGTAADYYHRFIKRFPNLEVLAGSAVEDVLQVWQGLGYYGRARNLHRSARRIMEEHSGRVPSDPAVLRALPGIGPYTAAAVASIAFNHDAAVLDGNVGRVLCRVFALSQDPRLPAVRRSLQALAGQLLPRGRAADFNQALMDLGALICRPRKPACPRCPLAGICRAYSTGQVEKFPARTPKPRLPRRHRLMALVEWHGRYAFTQRPQQGLLAGLWEFPGLYLKMETQRSSADQKLRKLLDGSVRLCPKPDSAPLVLTHTYTHFREMLTVFQYTGQPLRSRKPAHGPKPNCKWLDPNELSAYPITGATRKILRSVLESDAPGPHKPERQG